MGEGTNRAAVLIGIDETGNMPKLRDAAKGARRMEDWARAQGIEHVDVFTDEAGPVDVGDVKKAIRKIVQDGGARQLLVYFAGHGINIAGGERWLFSAAPVDADAAVNVPGSAERARFSGIPHVVFISDACRTAADSTQAQLTEGSQLFPVLEGDEENAVDLFFACRLGRPSVEIQDAKEAAKTYKALYTESLLDALLGKRDDLLEALAAAGDAGFRYVRPWPLSKYLEADVTRRIVAAKLHLKGIIQTPVARIGSDPEVAWMARVAAPAEGAEHEREAAPPPSPPPTVPSLVRSLIAPVLRGDAGGLGAALDSDHFATVAGAGAIPDYVREIAAPFGPGRYETACGFKISGARFDGAFCARAQTELLDGGEAVRMHGVEGPGASVLLALDGARGTVLPAIPEFIGALTVEDGELVNVSYEPSDNHPRWKAFERQADELRALRAVASAASRDGAFRLDGSDALELARRMQVAKGVDPALAVYAAYAYNDAGRRDLVRKMRSYMRADLGAALFDLELIARRLVGRTADGEGVLGFMPLLAQGWALLGAHDVRLAPSLQGIERSLQPSLWTLLDGSGLNQVQAALSNGEVR